MCGAEQLIETTDDLVWEFTGLCGNLPVGHTVTVPMEEMNEDFARELCGMEKLDGSVSKVPEVDYGHWVRKEEEDKK